MFGDEGGGVGGGGAGGLGPLVTLFPLVLQGGAAAGGLGTLALLCNSIFECSDRKRVGPQWADV